MDKHRDAKIAAGRKAAEWIESGMIVGLGTGSTAECFIDSLIERCKKGLRIKAVASSRASAERAKKGGIAVEDINSVPRIHVTVDGADEIDLRKRMIKGGGGAHVREKILACASDEMVVVVDESKLVDSVGKCKLPVEVIFYGSPATRLKIETLGYKGKWRINPDGTLFISENGNLIFDIFFDSPPPSPELDHDTLIRVPGVVDTGFFFNLAGRVVVGFEDGNIEVR
jgi:ribose 5-phosphate isomerase A